MTARKPTADRKIEIADATLEVIGREGLGRFTAASLAKQVGVSDGALFRHFPNMDLIIEAAIDRAEEVLFEGFPPTQQDPLQRLGTFYCQRLAAIRRHPGVVRAIYSNELAHAAGERGAARVAEFRRRSVEFVRGCLHEAARNGQLTQAGKPRELAIIVLGSIMAVALSPEGGSKINPQELWKTLEHMLRAESPDQEMP